MTDHTFKRFDIENKAEWDGEIKRALSMIKHDAQPNDLPPQVLLYCTEDPPTGRAYDRYGVTYLMTDYFSDPDGLDKAGFVRYVQLNAVAGNALASIAACEAWASERFGVPSKNTPPPYRSDNRQEVLFVTTAHRSFGMSCYRAVIERDPDDKRLIQEWVQITIEVRTDGVLVSFVPPLWAITPEKRSEARILLLMDNRAIALHQSGQPN